MCIPFRLKSSNLGAHIYKLWLGLVQPRNGGLPTKLTFWITPYDFLNEKDQTSHPITIDSKLSQSIDDRQSYDFIGQSDVFGLHAPTVQGWLLSA